MATSIAGSGDGGDWRDGRQWRNCSGFDGRGAYRQRRQRHGHRRADGRQWRRFDRRHHVGGSGGDSILIDAVSGSTDLGTLHLSQTATGGNGGDATGAPGGVAGTGSSTLVFDDTAQSNVSDKLIADVVAEGGDGGNAARSGAMAARPPPTST